MRNPADDEQASSGAPHPSDAPRDGAPDAPASPAGAQPRVVTPQDTLSRLLDRRATADGAYVETLLRALVDAAPFAMWVLDLDGRVVLWNPATERLTGWSADEALGKTSPIVSPDKVEEFRTLFAKVLRKDPVVDIEVRRTKKDGSSLHLSLSSAAILAPDGTVAAVLMTAREAADAGRDRFATIVESINDAYAAFDHEWRYTYVNRRYTALVRQDGKDADALIGRVVWNVFPEIVGTKFHTESLRAVREGQPVEFDEYYAPLDQTLNVRVFPTPSGVVTITRDVTERRRAEHALEQSESRFRSLVEASSQIVWTTDAEGRIVTPTPEWIALTGQAPTDAQGYGMLDAVHPDERDEVGRLWHEAIAAKQPFTVTFRLRVASGAYRWFAARGVPVLNADGSVREWVGTSSDIHERKTAEAALRESEARFRTIAEELRESERRHRRIFDTVEVSIWEEDFSAVKEAVDALKREGVTDIRRYLADHPSSSRAPPPASRSAT